MFARKQNFVWLVSSVKDSATTALTLMSREGREGGEGFFMDKIFDRSKINL